MRAGAVLSSLLNNNAGVTVIVGTKVFAMRADQGVDTPYVVYWKDGADRTPPLGGQPSVVEAVMNVIVAAADYPAMKTLGEAVRVALLGQYGLIAGVQVMSILIAHEGADDVATTQQIYWQPWQYRVTHMEP